VIGATACAVIVRLVIIGHSHGGEDLRMYVFFSRLPLHGINPFSSYSGGLFPPVDGNNPPGEVALFSGLLWLHDSPTTLRLLFVLSDAALLLVIGFAFPRPRRWRAAFILFYGFNPFVLFAWTAFAEDKTLLLLGIVWLLLALERERQWSAWAAISALTVFKFLGAFAAPSLAVHALRSRGRRALAMIAAFAFAFVLGNLPWFPHSLDAFSRRNTRLAINPPIHASPLLLLSRIGVYAPIEAKLLTVLGIALVFALFVARRINVQESVVWSLFTGYAFLPDDSFARLLLITLPFLLIVDLSMIRWLALWAISCVAALAAIVATRGVPHILSFLSGPLRSAFSHESTVRHVIWMNLLPALVLTFYFRERRADTGATVSARSKALAIAS
jgi:hypothetical protein